MTQTAQRCLVLLCALLVVELAGLAVVPHRQRLIAPPSSDGTAPELRAAGQRLGISTAALDRIPMHWGLPPGLREPRRGYATAAYRDGRIYVRPGADAVDAVAYEYLHDVWAHLRRRSAPASYSCSTGSPTSSGTDSSPASASW